jgi:DNA-binding MarR family transcriptional regulator
VERLLRTPALLAWLRLQRVEQKVNRAASAGLSAAGLTDAQFYVLAHVGATEGLMQQELADARLVTQANICQMVNKLEAEGLLVRRRDGRSNRLFLTERGRVLIADVVPAQEALIAELFACLPLEQQALLHQLLRELDRALDCASADRQQATAPRPA